jgi:hypothetical protein
MSDFPKAFVNIGQVLVPLLNESLITFNDVFEISEPLKDFAGMKPPRGMFIKDILTVVEQEGGSVIRFMIANQVDIKAFFKPGTKDDVPKKWLFRTSNDLPKVVLLNEITNRIYALAGAEPKSYRWFHATEDQDVLNRDDFDSLVSRAVLDYLGDTVIFKEQGEASPEIYDSLETQLSLLQPVLEIVNPLVLLTTTQEFCTEKQILGITCLLDVYLGDILFRLFHNFNLVTTETFLEYKSSCSPEIAKKLSGWFKHLQAIQ